MTIVCAVRDVAAGRVFIGSDTLCESGDTQLYLEGGKWAVGPHWAIGLAGNLRFNLLATELVPSLAKSLTVMAVAKALRDLLREDGAVSYDEKGDPQSHNLCGLITDGDKIWDLDCSYAPLPQPRFSARGIGREFARGAMWAMEKHDRHAAQDAQFLLCVGLDAAIKNCRACGGEMWAGIHRPQEIMAVAA